MNPKTIRETAGLSVRELAEKMDVSTQRIYAIEAADDWMVSTIEAYYKACAGPVDPESRGLLLLASRCLSGSLERWVSRRGSQEAVEADFQNLCDTWPHRQRPSEARVALLEKLHDAAREYLGDEGPCPNKQFADDPDCGFEGCLYCALDKAASKVSTETNP